MINTKPVADISVAIPAVRSGFIHCVLRAFELGTMMPAEAILVSNELVASDVRNYPFPVRILAFDSEAYSYGYKDWALRRNIGVWEARSTNVLCFDDDEIPHIDMVAALSDRLSSNEWVWGHHRFIDFDEPSDDENADALIGRLHSLSPEAGRSRECAVNHRHLFLSGYGGLFACNRALLMSMGGFDMIYNGYGREDQACARQLSVFRGDDGGITVHEPPFAWCSNKRFPILFMASNGCEPGCHNFTERIVAGQRIQVCTRCPTILAGGIEPMEHIQLPFNRTLVEVREN